MKSIFGRDIGEGRFAQRLQLTANAATVLSFVLAVATPFVGDSAARFILPLIVAVLIAIAFVAKKLTGYIDDLEVIYEITLTNLEGDAWIQRNTTVTNRSRSAIIQREHVAFSTGPPVDSLDALQLKAWDSDGHQLECRQISDFPTQKRFEVIWHHAVSPLTEYTYGYKFFWPKMFQNSNETFTGKDTAKIVQFIVRLPDKIRIRNMHCVEIGTDGRNTACLEIARKEDAVNRIFYLKVAKIRWYNNVELRLLLERF